MVQHEKLNNKLIVALDVPTVEEAIAVVDRLGATVSFYKIGLQLQPVGGDRLAAELLQKGKQVFLDYKYHDIGRTVEAAVRAVATIGVDFLSVHGNSAVTRAAVEGRGDSNLKLFAVTVLTSMDADDLREMGMPCSLDDLVDHRARNSIRAGCDGVVASVGEVRRIKKFAGQALVVTPGIRPPGGHHHDQKRTATVEEAIAAGSDYLVVGRPILTAPDPKGIAERIVQTLQTA